MADANGTQNVQWGNIFSSLQKVVSNITSEFVGEAYNALGVNKADRITKEDFISMMNGDSSFPASPGKAKQI